MKHKTTISIAVLASTLLAACTTTSETFDCEAGRGVGCKSISQVNNMVDDGLVGNVQDSSITSSKNVAPVINASDTTQLLEGQHLDAQPGDVQLREVQQVVLSDNSIINRASEEPLRIWIAPFQDEHGNFHEGSFVHTIIRPSFWHMQAF